MPTKEVKGRGDQHDGPDQNGPPSKFVFDVALSTAIAANGEGQATDDLT